MNSLNKLLTLGSLTLCALLMLAPLTAAQTIGTVVMVRGDVTAENAQGEVRSLSRRSEVQVGDLLSTGTDARLQVRMIDNALIDLRPETALRMEVYQGESPTTEDRVLMDLVNGTLSTLTGTFGRSADDAYEVRAASATIGIRGTAYGLFNDRNNNTVFTTVTNGIVVFGSPNGNIVLGPNQPFRNGRIIGGQRPQGLLLPPQELLDALLSGNEGGEEGEEGGNGEGDTDTAGSPPVQSDINDPQRDNESVTGGTLLTSGTQQTQPPTQENQISFIDRRLSSSEQTAVTTSQNLFFGSGALGTNMTSAQGVMVFRPTIVGEDFQINLNGFAAIYNDGKPSFASGYVPADSILRLNPDAQGDNEGWVWAKELFDGETHFIDYEDFQERVSLDGPDEVPSPVVSWGYWDMTEYSQSGTYLYDNYQSANPTQELGGGYLWYVIGEPDAQAQVADLSFIVNFIEGSDSNGVFYDSGWFEMDINSSGMVSSVTLELYNAAEFVEWSMSSAQQHAIVNGVLNMDSLTGYYTYDIDSFEAVGNLNGFFNQTTSNDPWFFGTYDLQTVSGDIQASGVVAAEGLDPN